MNSRIFLSWFLSTVATYFVFVSALNFFYDPFYKYQPLGKSRSHFQFAKSYNEALLKLSLLGQTDKRSFIIGDSRGNVFTEDVIKEVDESRWINLSMGGAQPKEIVGFVDRLIEKRGKNSIDEIMIVLPIRLFVDRRVNRLNEAESILDNNFVYLTNTLVFRSSMANLIFDFTGIVLKTQKQKGSKEEAWKFWLAHAKKKTLVWEMPNKQMQSYKEVFERLRENGIKFKIVSPPVYNGVVDIYSAGMPDIWDAYLSFLQSQPETVICLSASYNSDYGMFNDPYHANKLFAKIIFDDLVNQRGSVCGRN